MKASDLFIPKALENEGVEYIFGISLEKKILIYLSRYVHRQK